jgi:hypothetical protein
MAKLRRSNKDPRFPLKYKGKDLYKEDCSAVFLTYYGSVQSLGYDKSVYVSSELGRVLPDGSWSNNY